MQPVRLAAHSAGMAASLSRALAVAGALAAVAPAAGAQDSVSPSSPLAGLLTERVAEAWRLPATDVRVEVAGELPVLVDSLAVAPAGSDRFLVTVWSGDDMVRRFAEAGHLASVPVAARRIERGETIDSVDVRHEVRLVPGAPSRPGPGPVGMVAERVLTAGAELRAPAVRPPYLVRGGETVEATLIRSGVVMTVRGEALGSAREGERLLVRLASGLRMEARARAPGRVTLLPGTP